MIRRPWVRGPLWIFSSSKQSERFPISASLAACKKKRKSVRTVVNDSAKTRSIEAYFNRFKERIAFLEELYRSSHRTEAMLLCCCYIDGLGSNLYPGEDLNKRAFVRVLREHAGSNLLSGVPASFFHERLEAAHAPGRAISEKLKPVFSPSELELLRPSRILSEGENRLCDVEFEVLKKHIWRATIAAIVYEELRCQYVHDLGGPAGLRFGESAFEGNPVPRIDFSVLHSCAEEILEACRKISLSTGRWFGHDFET